MVIDEIREKVKEKFNNNKLTDDEISIKRKALQEMTLQTFIIELIEFYGNRTDKCNPLSVCLDLFILLDKIDENTLYCDICKRPIKGRKNLRIIEYFGSDVLGRVNKNEINHMLVCKECSDHIVKRVKEDNDEESGTLD